MDCAPCLPITDFFSKGSMACFLYVKTGKVVPVHGVKAYRGKRGRAPFILNLDEGEW
jgi:hypothetical protein